MNEISTPPNIICEPAKRNVLIYACKVVSSAWKNVEIIMIEGIP